MRYVADRTGRFQQRPHYEPAELDAEFERVITTFLCEKHGEVRFPIDTNDLTTLIERDAQDIDLYADLSEYGSDVEGVTIFSRDAKPKVAISAALYANERQHNRLRTTLTHEYGHVRLHSVLWAVEPPSKDLLTRSPRADRIVCKRDSMLDATVSDWMEWQAGYACGAILMPKSVVVERCRAFVEERAIFGALGSEAPAGREFVHDVMAEFGVSEQAAMVRLMKLELLVRGTPAPTLFG